MKNWKTTSAGILAIVTSITGLVFAYLYHKLDQNAVTLATTGILTGIGLIAATDSTPANDPSNTAPKS